MKITVQIVASYECDPENGESVSDAFDAAMEHAKRLAPPKTPPDKSKLGQPVKPAPKPAAPKPAPKPAPAPAAKGKAAAKPPPKKPEPEPETGADLDLDLSDVGGEPDEDAEDGGLGLGDGDDAGPNGFEGTPAEAREEALSILRVMMANKHRPQVKEVQTRMGVAKFYDVPAERGFEFLRITQEIQATIGVD